MGIVLIRFTVRSPEKHWKSHMKSIAFNALCHVLIQTQPSYAYTIIYRRQNIPFFLMAVYGEGMHRMRSTEPNRTSSGLGHQGNDLHRRPSHRPSPSSRPPPSWSCEGVGVLVSQLLAQSGQDLEMPSVSRTRLSVGREGEWPGRA